MDLGIILFLAHQFKHGRIFEVLVLCSLITFGGLLLVRDRLFDDLEAKNYPYIVWDNVCNCAQKW